MSSEVTVQRSYTMTPVRGAYSVTVKPGVTLPLKDGQSPEGSLRVAHEMVQASILEELEALEEVHGGFREREKAAPPPARSLADPPPEQIAPQLRGKPEEAPPRRVVRKPVTRAAPKQEETPDDDLPF